MNNSFLLTNIHADKHLSDIILEEMKTSDSKPISRKEHWISHTCRGIGDTYSPNDIVFRLDHTKEWSWFGDPMSLMVKELLEPFEKAYDHMTRVVLLIQRPGFAIPQHTDWITGQIYKNDEVYIRPNDIKQWFGVREECKANPYAHENQHFYGGRLALGQQSHSYVVVDGQKTYYETGNEFFLLDEKTPHGADSVDYWRGVVFVDGILNIKFLNLLIN